LLGLGLQGAILQGVGLNLCVCAGLAGTGKRGAGGLLRLLLQSFPGNAHGLGSFLAAKVSSGQPSP
jgi:hypothetical protein